MDAVRKHMGDKGHCKMLHEGIALAEYAEFYDYSSSYPDNVSNFYYLIAKSFETFEFIQKISYNIFICTVCRRTEWISMLK